MITWIEARPSLAVAILALIAIAVISIVVLTDSRYETLNFVPTTYDAVVDILTPVFLIALLVERALEVFVTGGLELERAEKDRTLQMAKERQAQLLERIKVFQSQLDAPGGAKPAGADRSAIRDRIQNINNTIGAAQKAERKAQSDLEEYRTHTRRIAYAAGSLLGFVISLAGIRVVAPLVDFQLAQWSAFQAATFHSLDVVLTAALIAGGASGIHKIIAVFSDFTEKTRRRTGEVTQ